MEQVRLTAADRERRQGIRREMKRLRSEMADEERQRLNHAIRNQLLDPRNGVLPAENPPAADFVVYCYVSCRGEADTSA
ncbi:MAG: hypothetical protein LUE86_03840, partial [Clostridiales bacterium]|nr:hypothetical protein [Clostridiales bacterium]